MELELVKVTNELSQLPDVLTKNSALADKAVAAVRAKMPVLDVVKATPQEMEAADTSLNALQVQLKEAYTRMNDRRKPFTQLFDEIKSRFTAEEKKVKDIGEEVKAMRDAIAKETDKRNRAALEQQQKALEKKQAAIDTKAYFANYINQKWAVAIVDVINKLHAAFYAKNIDELDAHATKLSKWTPVMSEDVWLTCLPSDNPKGLPSEECQALLEEVIATEKPRLAKEWAQRLSKDKSDLLEIVPSRKRELERGDEEAAAQRIAQENAAREAQAAQDAADREAALQSAAEMDKMNAAFESTEASPVVSMSKGTQVKRKYVPKSHKAWAALMQSWVKNDMAGYTLEELGKKLSFMKTACEGRLNKGEELQADGLEIEDDYSTRARKTA